MKYAIIGGDLRCGMLAEQLYRDGHRVHSFALEKAPLPGEIPRDSSLQPAVYGADCVVLPVPVEKAGALNTPLSEEELSTEQVLESLWPGQILFGGGFSGEQLRLARQQGLRVVDLLKRQDFAVANAALTAEGALGLLIEHSSRAIWGGSALICGWGRIGRLLALRLDALGARVTVAARRDGDRAMIRALGMEGIDYGELESRIGDFDYLVNTVPARVIGDLALCCVPPDCLLLELASPPGGFDRGLAENMGLKTLAAPGLPGKSAPWAAAGAMKESIEAALGEMED